MAAVQASADGSVDVVACAVWSLRDPNLVDHLRAFRKLHRLPQELRVAIWPKPTSRGVNNPLQGEWAVGDPPSLNAVRMRDAVAPLVRAGYWVTDAIPAHLAVKGVGKRLDSTSALLVAFNTDCGVMVTPDDEVTYLAWKADDVVTSDQRRLLARYQFAAAITPKLRAFMATRADAIVTFGTLPDLRSFVMPLIEELDQEVMVIDQPEADVRTAEPIPTDPDSIASMQVVLATALGLDSAR